MGNNNLDVLLAKLQGARQDKPNHWMAKCPSHEDRKQSLSITLKNDRILISCLAGCDTPSVLRNIDSNYKDLFLDDKPDLIVSSQYTYVDEDNKPLYYCIRYIPKTFRQCHPGPNGETIWNLEGVRRVLYHLPDVIRAVNRASTIFLAEGEKDVDNLWFKALQPASCNPMGAGKWRDEYTETLKGAREIVIIPDNDQPGYNHARTVAEALYKKVHALKILTMPAPYKDFSDWMESIPKWDNTGRQDYDCEMIPLEFKRLTKSAIDYTPDYRFPSPRVFLQTAGGIKL